MDDLVAFLRARLDEDEQVACEAADLDAADELIGWVEYGSAGTRAGTKHLERFNPKRMLREVEAKRQLVDECELESYDDPGNLLTFGVLAHLASVYSGHPDYHEKDWRP